MSMAPLTDTTPTERCGLRGAIGRDPAAQVLHYAELTLREPSVGCAGEALQAHTQWVAFRDIATWPAALAASVDPASVVRIRFPDAGVTPPKGAKVRILAGRLDA